MMIVRGLHNSNGVSAVYSAVCAALLFGLAVPAAPARAAVSQVNKAAGGDPKQTGTAKDKKKQAAKPAEKKNTPKRKPAAGPETSAAKLDKESEIDPALRKKIEDILRSTAAQEAEQARTRGGRQPAQLKAGDPALRTAPVRPAGRESVPSNPPNQANAPSSDSVAKVNIPPASADVPPEERTYVFSIKEGSYRHLLDAFARMTDLGMVGDGPRDGKVTLVSAQAMTFKEAFARVRMLLFRYKPHEPFWLIQHETHLEVIRVNDFYRILPRERMYRSVEEFRAATLPDDELALVIYTPKSGAISDLKLVRDFLPDYVRVAPLNASSVTIFALVGDINKYLELIPIFAGRREDPRPIERIRIHNTLPTAALERLRQLSPLDGGSKRRVSRAGRSSKDISAIDTIPEPEVTIVPDDAQGVLIVRAMQDKIDEIKRLLPYIDVDTSVEGLEATVIPVEHANPDQLLSTIQQVLAVLTPSTGGKVSVRKVPTTPRKRTSVRVPSRSRRSDGITLIVHPTESAIVVIADQEDTQRVRVLVEQFDVPGRVGPIRIVLTHANADEVATAVNAVLAGGLVRGKPPTEKFRIVSEPGGKAVWFSGTEKSLAKAREIVAVLDTVGPLVSLRVVNLRFQSPSFVAEMLREFDQQSATPMVAGKPTRPKRSAGVKASRFTPYDEQSRLFVLCNDKNWNRYKPIIDQLEAQASERKSFERLAVEHLDPHEAVQRLAALMSARGPSASASLIATDDGILVMNPNEASLSEIRELLAEIDRPTELIRRTFELRYRDPAEILAAVEALIIGEPTAKVAAPRRPSPVGKSADVKVGLVQSKLTIVQVGSSLVVSATPQKMKQVAALIAELDIADGETELRVFDEFPPLTDVGSMAEALTSVFSTRRGNVKRGARPAANTDAPRFIPQPAFGKLIVIAPLAMFEEIEVMIEALKGTAIVVALKFEFIDVLHVDADILVSQVTPLLDLQVSELIATGELEVAGERALTPGKPIKRRPGQAPASSDYYHLAPDAANDRIVVAAPPVIIERARELIANFDRKRDADKPIFRTVVLAQADAAEVIRAVKEVMGRPPARPAARVTSKRATSSTAHIPRALVITEAPGGGAIVLHGLLEDVKQAIEWIKTLDAMSTHGQMIKVYDIQHADIKSLVDLIMAVVDRRSAARPVAGKSVRARASMQPIAEEDEFELTKTWTGHDIYIRADLITSVMVVVAPTAKLREIDEVVTQFDIAEGPVGAPVAVPSFLYELRYADAFDAEYELQGLLDQLWNPPDEVPQVESALFGDYLIVRYPREERFAEIEAFIEKYVDKRDKDYDKIKRRGIKVPKEMKPSQLATWLQNNLTDLNVEVIDVSKASKKNIDIERVGPLRPGNPCVLPLALTRLSDEVLFAAIAQVKSDAASKREAQHVQPRNGQERAAKPKHASTGDAPRRESSKDPRAGEDDEADLQGDLMRAAAKELLAGGAASRKSTDSGDAEPEARRRSRHEGEKLKVYINNVTGNVTLEARSGILDDVPDWLEDLKEELEDVKMPPDIRVFRLRYIGVYEATEIIEEMFNATRQQRQQVQVAQRRQQQLAAQRARQLQQQRQQQQKKGQQPGQTQRPGRGQQQTQQAQAAVPQLPEQAVRIYPNHRDRTLILRAETSQYPALLELIATIDQPKPIDSELRIFKLDKLNAVEVEAMLTKMLDLEQKAPRAAATPARAGRRAATTPASRRGSAGGHLPRTIMQETVSGKNRLGVDPQDIKLSSNEASNTILVMAPKAALDFVGDLIKQLESEDIPDRVTKHYELKHAAADEVAEYLVSQFEAQAGRGGSPRRGAGAKGPAASVSMGRSLNTPSFIPYPRLNLLSVLATSEQLEEIDGLVIRIDVSGDEHQWEHVSLRHADAKAVADTLSQMFGSGGASRGPKAGGSRKPAAADARFIGEEGGRVLLYSASVGLREPILSAIETLEAGAKDATSIRIIVLKYAAPGRVADAIESAYGPARRGGGRAAGARLTVTAHDASDQLFIQTDDQTFAEIESLVKAVDKPGAFIGEVRFYPLQHADAKQFHVLMTKLVAEYVKRLTPEDRKDMPAFSVEVDENANALIVLGSSTVFGFIEEHLAKIDIPANAASPVSVLMVSLTSADAQEVAGNINRLWAEKGPRSDRPRAQAEANRSANLLIIRGPQDELDEIKKQFIDPLQEQAAPALLTEMISLEFADPEAVAETINNIFEARRKAIQSMGARGSTISPLEFTVVVTPQVSTKQVMVQASASNMPDIKKWISQFDRKDVAEKLATTVKIYSVKFVDVDAVVRIINEWGRTRQQGGGKGAKRNVVVASSEPMTQSIVVTASYADHVIIAEMINGLEGAETSRQEVHVINLQNADAESVARVLTEIFVRSAPRSSGAPPITVSAVQGSKAVLVKCKTEVFADIQAVVSELDTQESVLGETVSVVSLIYADVVEVEAALRSYLTMPGSRGRGELVGDTRLSVLSQSNALVLSGDKQSVAHLEKLANQLDLSGEKGSVPQIIKLKHANARQLETTLSGMFTDQPRGKRNQTPTIIKSNEAIGALIVRAGPTEFAAIEAMIEQLDTEDAATQANFRLVQIGGGLNVTDVAAKVEEAINEGARAQAGSKRGGDVPSIRVTPDTRTQALIVSGSPELFAQAADMAKALEALGPPGGRSVKIITLTNTHVEDVERVIALLKGEEPAKTGRSTRKSPKRPRRPSKRGK